MTTAADIALLQTLGSADLARRYTELVGKAPRIRNVAWLRRQIAWKLQEREFGGLGDRAKARLAELMAAIDLPVGKAPPPPPRALPRPEANTPVIGTVLMRKWHDQELRVEVVANGFVWNGARYSSLSAVAKAITGASWNGRLFFGLVERRKAT